MNFSYDSSSLSPAFQSLPATVQEETLALIRKVNDNHLHFENRQLWPRVHYIITESFAFYFLKKQQKKDQNQPIDHDDPAAQANDQDNPPGLVGRVHHEMIPLNDGGFNKLVSMLKSELQQTFKDTLFTDPIIEAFQQHILSPLRSNSELLSLLTTWIKANVKYLPLGTHLLDAYKEDMKGNSDYYRHLLVPYKNPLIPEALSDKTIAQMTAFLAEAAQAHSRSCPPPGPASEKPTAVMLSVKNGAGGHTAPTQAMASRLQEIGWRVVTVHYDTDLSDEDDVFQNLAITFADGTPMTQNLFQTHWKAQKQERQVSKIVEYYVNARMILEKDLFSDDSGGDLLRRKVLPENPQLLVTTLAYHWSWRTLAYRVTGAKTILVASDVFFHREAADPWWRQKSFPPELRKIHFTTMTDDIELLEGMYHHHDAYYRAKYPGHKIESMKTYFEGLHLDDQISVIGAPIHPAFDAVTDPTEISRLRKKWGIPDGAMSVCISRGKLGYASDLGPALEGYRTTELLPKPVILHVVCGENKAYYDRLVEGSHTNLAPNITVVPHQLLKPADFAELRAISTVDDIKAGGGSTFEGWYLISKGSQTLLLLTPGPDLWWERSNCDAMEKWGIGRTVEENSNKIPVLKTIMEKGLPKIKNQFPDWKKPFDQLVSNLLTGNN